MRPFPVHSTKYDGSLHYRYMATVVREEPSLLMLYAQPGIPVDCYRGQFTAKYHSLHLYWSDRFYNVNIHWYADWRPRMYYVNVATPASWNDRTLRFVDLDLDVMWYAETDEVILDDEDEFALHQVRFGYPSDLIAQARGCGEEVREMIARRVYPFDGSLLDWRPNGSP